MSVSEAEVSSCWSWTDKFKVSKQINTRGWNNLQHFASCFISPKEPRTACTSRTSVHLTCRRPSCCEQPPAVHCRAGPLGPPQWTAALLLPAVVGQHLESEKGQNLEPSGFQYEPPGNKTQRRSSFNSVAKKAAMQRWLCYVISSAVIFIYKHEWSRWVIFKSTHLVWRGAVETLVQSSRSQQGRVY